MISVNSRNQEMFSSQKQPRGVKQRHRMSHNPEEAHSAAIRGLFHVNLLKGKNSVLASNLRWFDWWEAFFLFSFVNLDYPCLLKTSSSIKLCVYLILCTCVYLKRYNNLLCVWILFSACNVFIWNIVLVNLKQTDLYFVNYWKDLHHERISVVFCCWVYYKDQGFKTVIIEQ